MTKTAMACVALLLLAGPSFAQSRNNSGYGSGGYGTGSNPNSHGNSGYTRQNGTVVQPYQSTNPNNTQMDNYGTRGNVNPYTGQTGTKSPRY